MKTRVVHCTKAPYDVYIGRNPNGVPNKWANPFIIGKDGTREEVIAKHKEKVLADPEFVKQIKQELRGKVLGCWCKPKCCHGDTYAEIADESDLIEY